MKRSLALLNPRSLRCRSFPYGVDRTWKSGRVSYLGNDKLAKVTYFSWIYRGLMWHSWKWWIIERSVALLNPTHIAGSSLPYGVDRTWKSGRVSNLGHFKLTKLTYFSWIYIYGCTCHSWKGWIIERSLSLLNPSSHCCQSSSIWDKSDMEKWKSLLSRQCWIGKIYLFLLDI